MKTSLFTTTFLAILLASGFSAASIVKREATCSPYTPNPKDHWKPMASLKVINDQSDLFQMEGYGWPSGIKNRYQATIQTFPNAGIRMDLLAQTENRNGKHADPYQMRFDWLMKDGSHEQFWLNSQDLYCSLSNVKFTKKEVASVTVYKRI